MAQYPQVTCNLQDHSYQKISAICTRRECDSQSALCQRCMLAFHQLCGDCLIYWEDLPKSINKLENESEIILQILEALIQKLKKIQKQYELNIKSVHEYQAIPNMANLNNVGKMLRAPKGSLESILTGNELISQLIENYLNQTKPKNLTKQEKDEAKNWQDLGDYHLATNEHQEAIQCYDKSLSINPMKANCWNDKGISLYHLKQYQEAIKCFDQAVKIDQYDASILSNIGLALDRLGKLEQAIQYFDKALQINPNHHLSWCNKGESLHKLNRFYEALQCFDNSINIQPMESSYYQKSFTLESLNQLEEAEICLILALELESDNGIIQTRLKHIQKKLKK